MIHSVSVIEQTYYCGQPMQPVIEVYFDDSGMYAVFDQNTAELRDHNDEVIRSMQRVYSSNDIRDEVALLLNRE